MRPFAILLGIVMGSSVSIAVGLAMTLVVFLFLPEASARVSAEWAPLTRLFIGTLLFSGIATASFYGELRDRRWRHAAHGILGCAAVGIVWGIWFRS